jgi:hypothetical protein
MSRRSPGHAGILLRACIRFDEGSLLADEIIEAREGSQASSPARGLLLDWRSLGKLGSIM